jgi:hypothetical protein
MDSIYVRMKRAGVPMDSHESDLYVPNTEETRAIIAAFRADGGVAHVSTFRSNKDKSHWLDIAFSFDPFWENRGDRYAFTKDRQGDNP